MIDQLPDRLDAAASEMYATDYADLRRRVDRTARGIGRRRAALASLCAVAVAAAGVAVAFQLRPPTHEVGPAVSRTPTASPTATGTPSLTSGAVPGTLVFLSQPRLDGTKTNLVLTTITDGVQHSVNFGSTDLHEAVRAVSPDLSKIAVVRSDLAFGAPGDLIVIEPGGVRTTVGQAGVSGPDYAPIWLPNSTAIVAADATANHTWYAYRTDGRGTTQRFGGATVPPYGARFPVWSANGQYLAYADRAAGLQVLDAVGTVFYSPFAYDQWPAADCLPAPGCPESITALSHDGRFLAVGYRRTSPGPRNPPQFVVDGENHRVLDLPAMAGDITSIFFTRDDSLLVYTVDYQTSQARFYLVSPDPTYRITRVLTAPYGQIGDLVAYNP